MVLDFIDSSPIGATRLKEFRRACSQDETFWAEKFKAFTADEGNRSDREGIAFFRDELKRAQRTVKACNIVMAWIDGKSGKIDPPAEMQAEIQTAIWATQSGGIDG